MKILIISGLYYPKIGGAEREAQKIAEAMIKKGINVSVLTQKIKNYPEFEMVNDVPVFRKIKAFKPWGITYFLSVLFFLIMKRKMYNIIICFGIFYYTPAAVIVKKLFKKLLINRIECSGERGDLKRIYFLKYNFLIKSLWKYVDKYIAITNDIASELKKEGIDNERIVHIPNSVDINKFSNNKYPKELNGQIRLIFVGRLSEQKGVDILLEAISKVIKKERNLILKIVGDGHLRSSLEILTDKLGISNFVKFEGEQQCLWYFYWNSDILIIPSRYEGLPLVLLEGMSCGLPVIASNIPGHKEVIEDGVNGLLFEKENSNQLAEKIDFLIKNPEIALRMGRNGREKVICNYSLEIVSEKYVELFESILRN